MISVDTKKKELVGEVKNGGREYQPAGSPEQVPVHDFPDKELSKSIRLRASVVGVSAGPGG